jgi:hypothetical protein
MRNQKKSTDDAVAARATESKFCPLEPDDVPPGSFVGEPVFGGGEMIRWYQVLMVCGSGAAIACPSEVAIMEWHYLMEKGWMVLRPGTNEWVRCLKESKTGDDSVSEETVGIPEKKPPVSEANSGVLLDEAVVESDRIKALILSLAADLTAGPENYQFMAVSRHLDELRRRINRLKRIGKCDSGE